MLLMVCTPTKSILKLKCKKIAKSEEKNVYTNHKYIAWNKLKMLFIIPLIAYCRDEMLHPSIAYSCVLYFKLC